MLLALPCATQAAEVSRADKVETTPGLSPKAIRKVFDSHRQTLAPCMRLVAYRTHTPKEGGPPRSEHFVWKPAPGEDDRLRLRFTLAPDGKLQKQPRTLQAADVQSSYLDDYCVATRMEKWPFPTFSGNPDERVQVELWARFRTTAAERKATLARIREDYTALCKAITPLSSDDRLPSPEDWTATLQRFLDERGPRMAPSIRSGVENMLHINIYDAALLLENSMDEAMGARIDCPRIRAWREIEPPPLRPQ